MLENRPTCSLGFSYFVHVDKTGFHTSVWSLGEKIQIWELGKFGNSKRAKVNMHDKHKYKEAKIDSSQSQQWTKDQFIHVLISAVLKISSTHNINNLLLDRWRLHFQILYKADIIHFFILRPKVLPGKADTSFFATQAVQKRFWTGFQTSCNVHHLYQQLDPRITI